MKYDTKVKRIVYQKGGMMRYSSKNVYIILCVSVFLNQLISAGVLSTASKVTTVIKHAGDAIDMAMNIASVGVTLWGSDADKARMAKGMQITGLITSIAKGDFASAQSYAESIRGPGTQIIYTPLPADDIIDADIVESNSVSQRSFGDVNKMQLSDVIALRGKSNKKIITIDDMKIINPNTASSAVELAFAANLPTSAGETRMYQLMNGLEILLQGANDSDPSKLKVICFTITQPPSNKKNAFSKLFGSLDFSKKEFGTITLPKNELNKPFYITTTNNQLGILHKNGNNLNKTTLIPNMGELVTN